MLRRRASVQGFSQVRGEVRGTTSCGGESWIWRSPVALMVVVGLLRTRGKCSLQRDRKWDAIGTVRVVADRTSISRFVLSITEL